MSELHRFTKVEFSRFKAFNNFSLSLRHFNILVGPNNAGKSTILAAFRILSAALRRAYAKSPEVVQGPSGTTRGYRVDLSTISIAEENIFYNYDDSKPATVVFTLSNGNKLTLFFSEHSSCILLAETKNGRVSTPSTFRAHFNCLIGSVPILGPVEHNEPLYQEAAARNALYNYRAARNFRNIWHHFPEKFDLFRSTLIHTWPGMDIECPVVDTASSPARLHMFCPERRIPREIFWAGFGFQVWCQMLTHIIQANQNAMFLIDEPDIYLHSDLQRQLLSILKNMGPDIIIATHSTEIITEAETNDIVLINKTRRHAQRIKDPSQLEDVFKILGSNLNPILTQLAKTKKAVFVEGKDFQIISKFARRVDVTDVSNRSGFAVIPVDGFNPERIRSLKAGMETSLGCSIDAAAILDRDYRTDGECKAISTACMEFCDLVTIHSRKEIENFLLVPDALDRAAINKVSENNRRTGNNTIYSSSSALILDGYCQAKKNYVLGQYLASRKRFERSNVSGTNETTINERTIDEFERTWAEQQARFKVVPGKDALSNLNRALEETYGISVTPSSIIEAMKTDEIPDEIKQLVSDLEKFSKTKDAVS